VSLAAFVQRRYVGSAVAFVAGASLALTFAPTNLWPLAFLAPAVLLWLWQDASPRRAAVHGFWFNAGTFAVGTYWLYIAISEIGHAPLWLTFVLMVGLIAIMGAYHALLGWFVAKYLPARGWQRYLVGIPGAWLLVEWFRSWFLTGFGWLALGYSQTDTWLAGFAPVVGQYGMGLAVLLVSGALILLWLGTRNERIAAGALVVALFGAGFGLRGAEWTAPSGSPVTVAVVQGAIPQDEKWIVENLPKTLDIYRDLTRKAHGAQLIVWPESAIPDLANNHIAFYKEVYQEASAKGSSLVMGAMRMEPNPKTGKEEYFNSVLAMDRASPGVGWYDKHHLVPFTEFVPLPEFVRAWLCLANLPCESFDHGAAVQEPFEAAGQRIAASVCYEDAYGSTQLPALRTATMLVNVTNDAWFGESSARYQHLQISRLRVMESGRPMVRAANTGVSALIESDGRLVATAKEYEADVLRGSLQPRIGLTPYARTGNFPIVILALVFAIVGTYFRRSVKSSPTAP
jgi:apolipoprotein N-acyltransferase